MLCPYYDNTVFIGIRVYRKLTVIS